MDSGAWVRNFGQNLKFRAALWAGVGQGTFLKLPGVTDFCTLFPPPPLLHPSGGPVGPVSDAR